MKRTLFLLLVLSATEIAAYGQVNAPELSNVQFCGAESPAVKSNEEGHLCLAARAVKALNRLNNHVLIYRSQGDFEESGKLAHVSLEVFRNDLQEVFAEVEFILLRLPEGRLKREIGNALYSYRDGEFFWRKMHQPRVVNVSAPSFIEVGQTPSEAFYASSIPYTVAIHWRQANKYLRRAAELIYEKN